MTEVNLVELATKHLLENTDYITEEDLRESPELILICASKIRHWMDNHPVKSKEMFIEN